MSEKVLLELAEGPSKGGLEKFVKKSEGCSCSCEACKSCEHKPVEVDEAVESD